MGIPNTKHKLYWSQRVISLSFLEMEKNISLEEFNRPTRKKTDVQGCQIYTKRSQWSENLSFNLKYPALLLHSNVNKYSCQMYYNTESIIMYLNKDV